ncbi:MAG: hypothetical protein WCE61_16400 [Candidatus Acidiferrum sp.]
MEVDSAPQDAVQSIDQIENADLVVGILADLGRDEVAEVCAALRAIPGSPRIVVLQNHLSTEVTPANAETAVQDTSVTLAPWPLQKSNAPGAPLESVLTAYSSIFGIGEKLGVRGCCVIASKLEPAMHQWARRLTEPLLEPGFDFVAPCFSRRKFDGLLNNSIVYPLTRSLYGKQIQNPMGPDLGVSRRLFQQLLAADQNIKPSGDGMRLLASIAPLAQCGNFQVCQAHLGARIYPPPDWTHVSSLLAEILGPLFLTMERNAACWQKMRSSSPVKELNAPMAVPHTTGTVDVGRMVNSFQQGARDLQEIWRLVLPPTTLLEINKLSRAAPEQFHIPDELWVRIIYDFALAHRQRTINRDHLLRSLTPLYLGWVASYASEYERAEGAVVDEQIERLSLAYETEKPYLVSRWRWPDRFNP